MAYEIPGFVYSEKADAAAITQYHAVQLKEDGLVTCPAGEKCDGNVQQPVAASTKETVRVMKSGISFAIAGAGGVTRGAEVVVGAAAGVFEDHDNNGDIVVGKALESVSAGEVFSVLLY